MHHFKKTHKQWIQGGNCHIRNKTKEVLGFTKVTNSKKKKLFGEVYLSVKFLINLIILLHW